ncbi:MAG TPA: MFS transporter [Candidatus Limnocylindria bacterium]|nr:MFS transporter [Candidatus Limnocylindria bacterium]
MTEPPLPPDDRIEQALPGSLWRDRTFVAVWSASTISIFGSLITRTALPFAAILVLAAGPFEIALIRSAEQIAALVVGLFAGAWVDRLRRRPIMIWADLGRAVLLGSIPIAYLAGALVLGHLLVVSFAAAVLTTFFDVADRSYLPSIVPRDRLVGANSALTASASVAEVTGFGIGGFLIQVLSAPIAIVIDAVSFVVSAVLLGTIKRKEPPPKPVADREPVWREIRSGMGIVFRSPVLRALALAHGGTHILWGIFGSAYLIFATQELGLGIAALGLIAGAGGLGSLAGSLASPVLAKRFGIGRAMLLGMVFFTIGNALIPLAPAGAVVLGAAFLVAQQLVGDSGATVYEILEVSLAQSTSSPATLGRVNATIGTFTTLLTLMGTIGGGIIAEIFGLRVAFAVGILGAIASIAVIWFSPVRHIRDAPVSTEAVMPGDESPLTE